MEFAKVVRSSSLGRKRVYFSNMELGIDDKDCIFKTPLKRLCSLDSFSSTKKYENGDLSQEKSLLQNLHQEILIKILCGVEHDDLKRLFFASKALREAAVIAKKSHFAFSTPRKTGGFKCMTDFGGFNNGVETPNAPTRSRIPRFRLTVKKLTAISVDLFAGDGEED